MSLHSLATRRPLPTTLYPLLVECNDLCNGFMC